MELYDVPYYAVIFTSKLKSDDDEYAEASAAIHSLAKEQDGFLGFESANGEINISVSYWKSEDAIRKWKQNQEHFIAQQKGRESWYEKYTVRVCKVEREYSWQ